MPGFEGLAQGDGDPAHGHLAGGREAELEVWREPSGIERLAVIAHLVEHVLEIQPDEVREHEAIVELGPPSRERVSVWRRPESRDQPAEQQLLREAHARVRWHFERAQLDEAAPAARRLGRVQLVDAELGAMRVAGHVHEEMPEDTIDEPRRGVRSSRELIEGDLELVEAVVTGLVYARRLTRRPDEETREEVRQRRMVVPVGDEAPQ